MPIGPATSWPLAGLYAAGLLIMAWGDLVARQIPNRLTVPMWTTGVAAAVLQAWPCVPGSALGGSLCAGGTVGLLYALGWAGGGDVKAAVALGPYLGPTGALQAIALALWGGGLFAVGLLCARSNLWRRYLPAPRQQTVPLGAALAAGAAWTTWGLR